MKSSLSHVCRVYNCISVLCLFVIICHARKKKLTATSVCGNGSMLLYCNLRPFFLPQCTVRLKAPFVCMLTSRQREVVLQWIPAISVIKTPSLWYNICIDCAAVLNNRFNETWLRSVSWQQLLAAWLSLSPPAQVIWQGSWSEYCTGFSSN